MTQIAIAQFQSSLDKATNLKRACEWIGEAKSKSAEIVAFPEFLMAFSPGSQSAEALAALAEPLDGPFIAALQNAARGTGIAVIANIYERCEDASERVYDTSVWIDNTGKVASAYRKLHLYDAFGFKESDKFRAGAKPARLIEHGDLNFAMMICYDLRFPELSRILTLGGANVLVAPSGWVQGDLKVDHWQTMIKARALENGCYVIAPDQTGNIYIGHSMIVDPLGRIITDMEVTEGIEVATLDLDLIKDTRSKLPLLQNRRTDVYAQSKLIAKA